LPVAILTETPRLQKKTLCVRCEVFTAVTVKNVVFWNFTSCGSCKNRHFGETNRLHHRGDSNRRARNNVLQRHFVTAILLLRQGTHVVGIVELDLVPLDPLYIPRLEFKEGSGNFRFKQVLTNVTIHGIGAFKVLNSK
jgi:hypothetical protein